MICRQCKASIPDGSRFCEFCSSPLEADRPVSLGDWESKSYPVEPRRNLRMRVPILFLRLVILCLVLYRPALADSPVPQWIERINPADYALLAADLPDPMTTSDLEVQRRAVGAGAIDADGRVSQEESFWLQIEQAIHAPGGTGERLSVGVVVVVLETAELASKWGERWHMAGPRANANDLRDRRLDGVGASYVGVDRVSIRFHNVVARFHWQMSGSGIDRVERVARLWLDKVARTTEVADDELIIELSIQENQIVTQGDNFPVKVWVRRGDGVPVPGASVELAVVSPTGRVAGESPVMITDKDGQGRVSPQLPWWPAYFTVCATVGHWQLVAEAVVGRERASLIRRFEIVELVISSAQVAHNLLRIMNRWQATLVDPRHPKNGVDEPFINSLWYPKGPKVNMRSRLDSRFAPYTSSALTSSTLQFLDGIRFSKRESERILMAGVDYGPVSGGRGLGHMAVALYPSGHDWDIGYVLESWWNQKKEVLNASDWLGVFAIPGPLGSGPVGRWPRGPWHGEYPTTGSDGGYYPSEGVNLDLLDRTRVLTYSPVQVLIVDTRGRRFGNLADGTFLGEITGAESVHVKRQDGTLVSLLSVPDGKYRVHVAGTGNGTFHLVTGTDRDIVNYGEQPIRSGEQAILALHSDDLRQHLVLSDGRQIAPISGFPEQQSPPSASESPPDEPLPVAAVTEPARVTGFAIQTGRRTLPPAGTGNVPVWLINTDAMANMNLNVHYDPAVVRPARNAVRGNLIPQALFEANVRDRGVVRLGFAQRDDIRGTGTIAQIPFEAVGSAGTRTPLRLEMIIASAARGELVSPFRFIHGEIVIAGADARLPGDTSGQGTLTALDVMNALKMSVDNLPVDMIADIDLDGQVTARDATLIMQEVVGH